MYALSSEENIYCIQKTGLKALRKMISPWALINTNFYIENGKSLNDPFNIIKRRELLMKNEIL